MQVAGHLARATFHAAFRLFVTAFFCASVSSIAVLAVSYAATREWPPRSIEVVALVAVAAMVTYAGVITVVLVELVRGVIATIEAVDHELVSVAQGVERERDPHHIHPVAS